MTTIEYLSLSALRCPCGKFRFDEHCFESRRDSSRSSVPGRGCVGTMQGRNRATVVAVGCRCVFVLSRRHTLRTPASSDTRTLGSRIPMCNIFSSLAFPEYPHPALPCHYPFSWNFKLQSRFRFTSRMPKFPSCAHFLNRVSKVIGIGVKNPKDLSALRPFLSSKEVLIVLGDAESILDLQGIYAVVEELIQLGNIYLLAYQNCRSRLRAMPSIAYTITVNSPIRSTTSWVNSASIRSRSPRLPRLQIMHHE